MLDLAAASGVDSIAHVIQVALTPVFLLSGIASLLGVFAGRLARVADRVNALTDKLETADAAASVVLLGRLSYLRKRSHALDVAVLLGALAGAATCAAALTLFIGSIRDTAHTGILFAAFGAALLLTIGALAAFLTEMLLASRGLRDLSTSRSAECEASEAAEGGDEESPEQGAAGE